MTSTAFASSSGLIGWVVRWCFRVWLRTRARKTLQFNCAWLLIRVFFQYEHAGFSLMDTQVVFLGAVVNFNYTQRRIDDI